MMKFGTPWAEEGPGRASTKPGLAGVGEPSGLRSLARPDRGRWRRDFPSGQASGGLVLARSRRSSSGRISSSGTQSRSRSGSGAGGSRGGGGGGGGSGGAGSGGSGSTSFTGGRSTSSPSGTGGGEVEVRGGVVSC